MVGRLPCRVLVVWLMQGCPIEGLQPIRADNIRLGQRAGLHDGPHVWDSQREAEVGTVVEGDLDRNTPWFFEATIGFREEWR